MFNAISEVFQLFKCYLPCSYMYACLLISPCKICSIFDEMTLVLLFSPFNEGCLQLLQKKITRGNHMSNFDNFLSF